MNEGNSQTRRRVHYSVAARLAESIFDGSVKPGMTLPSEMDLCERFGVSRTAVREAIQVLAAKGLVQARRRVGTVVLDYDSWNCLDPAVLEWASRSSVRAELVRDLIDVLLLVEPAVAALAAERATVQEVAELDRACRDVASSLPHDPDAFAKAELDFHFCLLAAGHNVIFRHLATILRAVLEAGVRAMPGIVLSRRRTIEAHRCVVEAVRLRRSAEARQSMQSLLEIVRDEFDADAALHRDGAPVAPPIPSPANLASVGVVREDVGLVSQFRSLYGETPTLYRVPGRVNLIGDHTDYCGGLVLPAALDRYTWIAAAPRQDRMICVHTDVLSEPLRFSLDDPSPRPYRDWRDYLHGVAVMLERAGYWLSGADVLLRSDLFSGIGLGASASLEVAFAYALCHVGGVVIDSCDLARCCQRSENEFVGVRCGIMDPFAVINCREGSALFLDCGTLESRHVPFPDQACLMLCNSGVRLDPDSSEYNRRRQECERGAALLSDVIPGVRSLRDVTEQDLRDHADYLPEAEFRRCRHVVEENARVLRAVGALEAGDLGLFGRLMGESHRSLRNNFQVSCFELDLLVELASATSGVYGARMTGSGFGGCIVALMNAEAAAPFTRMIGEGYLKATGRTADVFPCRPCSGVGLWSAPDRDPAVLEAFFPKETRGYGS